MIVYEDECVECPSHMGCLGNACPYMNIPHYCCDECGDEFDPDELRDVDGEMICEECLFKRFPKIRI